MDLQPLVGVPGDAVRLAVVDEPEPPDERQVKTDALDVCHIGIIPNRLGLNGQAASTVRI